MEHGRRDLRVHAVRGQQLVERRHGHLAAEPAKAAEEDELELLHDRPGHAEEQVVEAAVGEVVFDAGTADPPDPPVDDHDLAVVDVTQRSQVPAEAAPGAEHPVRRARLRRTHHADLRAGLGQALVEDARTAFGIRALPVDDEPDGDAVAQLLDERIRELLPDLTGTEAELVDMDGRGRRADVGEHRRVERPSLDEDLDRRRAALGEAHREVAQGDGAREESLRVLADPVALDGDPGARPHAAGLVGVATAHPLRGLRGVCRDVERDTERDQHVVPEAVDPDDGRPGDDEHQRRPGQEQEPEQAPDPARDRGVGLVAEDPPEEQGDPRPDAAGEEENATHARESGLSPTACQPSSAPGRRRAARSETDPGSPRAGSSSGSGA